MSPYTAGYRSHVAREELKLSSSTFLYPESQCDFDCRFLINRCFEGNVKFSDAPNSHTCETRMPSLRRQRRKDGSLSPARFHQESIKESGGDVRSREEIPHASYHVRVPRCHPLPPSNARRYIMRTHFRRLLVISCEGGCAIAMVVAVWDDQNSSFLLRFLKLPSNVR